MQNLHSTYIKGPEMAIIYRKQISGYGGGGQAGKRTQGNEHKEALWGDKRCSKTGCGDIGTNL